MEEFTFTTSNNDLGCPRKHSYYYEPSNPSSTQSIPRLWTAPPRPLNNIQEFKRSKKFLSIEQAIVCSHQLSHKEFDKLDLDSDQGQTACQKYLQSLQKMVDIYKVVTVDRSYRQQFSEAYKVLYKENKLSYLTQILDSAQEGFPYLWVNSEKFQFSKDVLISGEKLIELFFTFLKNLKVKYNRLMQDDEQADIDGITSEIKAELQEFDFAWSNFQKKYVLELMEIEVKARRLILEAIEIQKQLHSVQIREKLKGKILINSEDYMNKRRMLCSVISQINQVSNYNGNFHQFDHDILCEAEGILRRVSRQQSKAIRVLAQKIRSSFNNIRTLLRKYQKDIEMVDPQLKNNTELVQALSQYQKSWQKGQDYFLFPQKKKFLLHFSGIIESLSQKYQKFNDLIQFSDADLFLIIPCIVMLKHLDNDDKRLCLYFLPSLKQIQTKTFRMFFQLQKQFQQWKKQANEHYCYYNILEKLIVGIDLDQRQKQIHSKKQNLINKMMFKLKNLAMELHRAHPLQWNQFLQISLAGTLS